MAIDFTRRSFIKSIGVATSGLILPSFDLLLPKEKAVPKFKMRILAQYDTAEDSEILRYDFIYKREAIFICSTLPDGTRNNKNAFIQRVHRPMVFVMKNHIKHHGLRPGLMKLPAYPEGYKHPEWLQEILYG